MSNSEVLWVAIGVVATPIVFIVAVLASKILWAFYPLVICVGTSAYAVYRCGLVYFFFVAIGISMGILATWLWQRTNVYLAGERVIEKITFTGD